MRYSLIGNPPKEIIALFSKDKYDAKNPEIVFSFGGDGTILKAINDYKHLLPKVMFAGINMGKLGFYTDFSVSEVEELLENIKNNNYDTNKYFMLDYCVETENETFEGLSLNELAIINPIHTQIIDVYLNGELFENFRGTGFVISTPTGSTAYSKSLGGSIIEPTIKAIQLTEIASINNNIYKTISSPLVLSETTKVVLKSDNFDHVYLSVDGRYLETRKIRKISTKLSSQKVTFLVRSDHSFLHRVKKSFL
ncbi:MAG: NAD kinase [Bacilli bacterium]|jgi:NAD+ kinase